jgi:dolichol-phosphate mannosyltransferase
VTSHGAIGADTMDVSVIVPTRNEAANVPELVARIESSLAGRRAEILFVDDSTDNTPQVIERVASRAGMPVRLIHRSQPLGGLAGAVVTGLASTSSDWCVVMDGDLQHPPEVIPALLDAGSRQNADVVAASRHIRGGSSGGLSGHTREMVSTCSTLLARAVFPMRLRDCSDPMTGFFAVRTASIDIDALRPRGFKILLEVLVRNDLKISEEPFAFAQRGAGQSKAGYRQGLDFLIQLATLRFGRLPGFALIGAAGAVANLAIMAALQAVGMWYVLAAILATAATIVGNFLLQERFVFRDLVAGSHGIWTRFTRSLTFNGTEADVRTLLLWWIVVSASFPSVPVQAALLIVGFLARFAFHSKVVYRPKPADSATRSDPLRPLSEHHR